MLEIGSPPTPLVLLIVVDHHHDHHLPNKGDEEGPVRDSEALFQAQGPFSAHVGVYCAMYVVCLLLVCCVKGEKGRAAGEFGW